jgi:hypothetical protein
MIVRAATATKATGNQAGNSGAENKSAGDARVFSKKLSLALLLKRAIFFCLFIFVFQYTILCTEPKGRTMAIKKTIRKTPARPAAKPAAVAAATPACGCGCSGGRFVKKLILFAVAFALGFAACHFICCGKPGFHGKRMGREMFVNGCLDASKIKRPEMMEKVARADIDGDGCITKEELRAQ